MCRDRGGNYAEGARAGAPDAIQVADRYHLWANLCKAVNKTVVAHHPCLHRAVRVAAEDAEQQAQAAAPQSPPVCAPPRREYPLATRTRQRFADVHECLARGLSKSAISRELNLDRHTVRRFANAESVEELLANAEHRPSTLDPWLKVVNQRWNEGVTNATDITAELRTLGFTGGLRVVQRYLEPLRPPPGQPATTARKAAVVGAAVPKPLHVTRWLLTHPDRLDEDGALAVKKATTACPHLERLHGHIRSFATIMAKRRGIHDLPAWLDAVDADDLPALGSFVTGIRRDLDAVINGLSMEHSSGAVEGAVTRAKALKRQCYGRAKFDLIRARILLTN